MRLRMRLGATVALALGVIVIIGSIVGGIALANRGNRPASTPVVMVGNDDNQTPTPGTTRSGESEDGTNADDATDDNDAENDATTSPEPSCGADDSMVTAEPSPEPSSDGAIEDHCPSGAPEHDD